MSELSSTFNWEYSASTVFNRIIESLANLVAFNHCPRVQCTRSMRAYDTKTRIPLNHKWLNHARKPTHRHFRMTSFFVLLYTQHRPNPVLIVYARCSLFIIYYLLLFVICMLYMWCSRSSSFAHSKTKVKLITSTRKHTQAAHILCHSAAAERSLFSLSLSISLSFLFIKPLAPLVQLTKHVFLSQSTCISEKWIYFCV